MHENELPPIKLPMWMNRGQALALAKGAHKFWVGVKDWAMWPLQQLDAETCCESVLDLLAYQRDIQRFKTEPLDLYRKRVKFAFINAKDSGSVAGFIEIFKRLGVGYVQLQERQAGIDWDVITVTVTDCQLSQNGALLMDIIRKYGRTCRRYRYEVVTIEKMPVRCGFDSGEYVCYGASLPKKDI